MWLRALRVNRYGAIQDRSWSGLKPGLNLLFGPNEAGKTTLMMFLRGMLFGFSKSPYDPLDLAEPGGSLQLLDAGGREWTLERSGRGKKARVLVSGPQGSIQGEAGVRPLLRDVSRPVFENIFAFSLKELQDLETLKHQEVKHLLYSASLGLGQVSLKAVEDRLDKQFKGLFIAAKRASTPEINQILGELGRVRREIQELERQPQQYQEWQAARAQVAAEVQRLSQEEAAAKREALWLDKLHQALKVWEDWRLAQDTLAALPLIDTFPEDGLARWEKTKDELDQVQDQLDRWRRDLEKVREEAARPGPDPRLLQAAGTIEVLVEERLRFADREEDLKQLERERTALRSRLEELLARLGSPWDENRLEDFRPPLNWQADIQEYQLRLGVAVASVRQAADQVRLRQETLKEKETAHDTIEQAGMLQGAARTLPWGFAALGLVLAVAAGAAYLWKSRDLARLLGAGAGMAFAAALANFWQSRANRRHRVQELAEERQTALTIFMAAAQYRDQEQEDLARLQEGWRHWLDNASLAPDLSPAGALALLQEMTAARSLLHDLQELVNGGEELETYLEGYTTRLGEVLTSLARPAVSRSQVSAVLPELRRELTAGLKLQEHQQQLAQKIRDTEKELTTWGARQERLQTALAQLLAAAAEQEEEGFRRRAAIFAERREMTRRHQELSARLRLLAGSDAALAQLQADLRQVTAEELEERLRQAATLNQDLQSRREEALQQQGKLQNLLEGLEQTDAWSRALLAEQTLAASLRDAAQRWTITTLSRHFLEQARACFEAEYQPQVLRRASQYFSLLTAGRYTQVMTPLEGESFLVINRQGSHLPPERLSRGTSEQLYLALRFALIQEYSQEGRSLPLILDDILVNFDQHRAQQAIRLLQEMSASHQLLLFTCHPHILDLVRETLGPQAPAPVMLEEKEAI